MVGQAPESNDSGINLSSGIAPTFNVMRSMQGDSLT